MNMSVRHTFGFPFYQRFWTITERPQRLVTFGTFDQSDGVYGGLNASRIGWYGGSNARICMMAAMLLKNIYTDGRSGMQTEI